MKSIQDLAREVWLIEFIPESDIPKLQRFHDLAIAQYREGLLAGVGEPFDDWPEFNHHAIGCGLEDRDITDRYEAMHYGWQECEERMLEQGPFYTADQLAAAVLREREACAKAVEAEAHMFETLAAAKSCAKAIRGQT